MVYTGYCTGTYRYVKLFSTVFCTRTAEYRYSTDAYDELEQSNRLLLPALPRTAVPGIYCLRLQGKYSNYYLRTVSCTSTRSA